MSMLRQQLGGEEVKLLDEEPSVFYLVKRTMVRDGEKKEEEIKRRQQEVRHR